MKLNYLTVQIFLGLAAVSAAVGGLGTAFLLSGVERQYIEIQAGANAQQAARVGAILGQELAGGVPENEILRRLQESLVETPFDNAGFLCLMGKGGKVLCHPDPQQVGTTMETPALEKLPSDEARLLDANPPKRNAAVGLIHNQTYGGSTHILYLQPVAGAAWTVAVHANFDLIRQRVARLRKSILQLATPTLIGMIVLGTLVARLVERRYERRIEGLNSALERRVAERTAELEQATGRYRSIFEGSANAIFLLDVNRMVTEANHRAEEISGLPQSTLRGRSFGDLCAKSGESPVYCTAIRDIRNEQCVWEAKLTTSGPTQRDVLVYENSIQEPRGTIVQAIVEDLTEKKLLEFELRQAQKLDAIGQLAGGVAHDFNNLLCAIGGYATLAQDELPNDSQAKSHLSEVLKASKRAGDLTRQLLAFSRKQQLEPQVINVNQTINGVLGMLRRIIGERVHIRTELASNLWPVLVDKGQLEQVILNLVVNARDAMPRGGTLIISTRNEPSPKMKWPQTARPGSPPVVLLAVTDTGAGIPDEIKHRIFEPFFTTKDKGSGTGLGLAVVHGIVRQHQGEIEFESRVGHGTTFRVAFPRARETGVFHEATAVDAVHRGTETLLIVEDDPAVRTLAEVMLKRLGYGVMSAANGDAALLLLSDGDRPIDMVLTDMVMPGLDVREFSDRLAKASPNVKIAYMTGYSDETDFLRALSGRGVAVLRKPFTSASLSEVVRRTLDACFVAVPMHAAGSPKLAHRDRYTAEFAEQEAESKPHIVYEQTTL